MSEELYPLVSVVIIAYNEERYLSDAIESVLNQTYPSIEVIVVDDGSKDNTLTIARRYEPSIKVISQKNSGGCSSPRNTGARAARGKYIAFLDADDIIIPEKIALQVQAFKQNPTIGMVIGNYQNFTGAEKYADHFSTCPVLLSQLNQSKGSALFFAKGGAASLLIEENFSIAGSPLYVKEAFLVLGGFDETLFSCEDFHLVYRFATDYDVLVDSTVIFFRRLHGANMSSNQLKMLRYYCQSRYDLACRETDSYRKEKLLERVKGYAKSYFKAAVRNRRVANAFAAALFYVRT